jgi:hypothetical protein
LIPDTVAPEAINRVRIQKPDFFTSSVWPAVQDCQTIFLHMYLFYSFWYF